MDLAALALHWDVVNSLAPHNANLEATVTCFWQDFNDFGSL